MITADTKDPNEGESWEYEYHRLMSIAEAFTGADKLRQSLPSGNYERDVQKIQKFIDEEEALREPHRIPYTMEAMSKKIDDATAKDDYYADRI